LLNDTTLLLGLEGLACQRVDLDGQGRPVVRLVTDDPQAARCPGCRQVSSSPKEYVSTRPRDLPHGGRGVQMMWDKRRWRCKNPHCGRGSFTESVASVPPRHRLTTRLRGSAGAAVADRGATVEQAGRDHGLSWPTVWAAAAAHTSRVLPAALPPVRVLGIDEVRRGARRWAHNPNSGAWEVAVDCWHVGFVDIGGGQGLLGQVEGRNRQAVIDWLNSQPQAWRDQIEHVAIDMCTVFASAVRQALPHATIVVDHFHLVQLANQAISDVRRRISWLLRGRRGRKGDGEWEVRRLLGRNLEDLSERRFARMWNTLVDLGDPGYDILAAYQAKELLRDLLALAGEDPSRHRIRRRLYAFYHWCATADLPELHRLATTVEQWWPGIEAFLLTGITNAKSEGVNRVAKLAARNAYGFRNPGNQRLRVRCATTRRARGHLSTRRTSRINRPRQAGHTGQTSDPPNTASYTSTRTTATHPPPTASSTDAPERLEPG
jgi:transposase